MRTSFHIQSQKYFISGARLNLDMKIFWFYLQIYRRQRPQAWWRSSKCRFLARRNMACKKNTTCRTKKESCATSSIYIITRKCFGSSIRREWHNFGNSIELPWLGLRVLKSLYFFGNLHFYYSNASCFQKLVNSLNVFWYAIIESLIIYYLFIFFVYLFLSPSYDLIIFHAFE